jgi:hypothetical protein
MLLAPAASRSRGRSYWSRLNFGVQIGIVYCYSAWRKSRPFRARRCWHGGLFWLWALMRVGALLCVERRRVLDEEKYFLRFGRRFREANGLRLRQIRGAFDLP